MATLADVELKTTVLESDDALSFLIEDDNTDWLTYDPADPTDVAVARVTVTSDYGVQVFNILTLAGDRTKWNEFLSSAGLEIDLADLGLTVDYFDDDYYQIKLEVGDAAWATANIAEYINHQAFLSHNRCKARKIASKLNDIDLLTAKDPISYYVENFEAFLLFMLMTGAEEQVSTGKITEFDETIAWINAFFTKYEIEDCF